MKFLGADKKVTDLFVGARSEGEDVTDVTAGAISMERRVGADKGREAIVSIGADHLHVHGSEGSGGGLDTTLEKLK